MDIYIMQADHVELIYFKTKIKSKFWKESSENYVMLVFSLNFFCAQVHSHFMIVFVNLYDK